MNTRIIEALKKLEIKEYIINEKVTETAELFFVKKSLDVRRMKDSHLYQVTLYREFMQGEKKCKGNAVATVYPGMGAEELEKTLETAYLAASFVANAWYELPDCKNEPAPEYQPAEKLSKASMEESCRIMTEALFAEDTGEAEDEPFINSAELFIVSERVRIITSAGADLSYAKKKVNGEFVVQCKAPQDVESYKDFEYKDLMADELRKKVKRTLEYTKARAQATLAPAAGKYNVIISGGYMRTLFDYYLDRSSAFYVYAGYSSFKTGNNIQFTKENESYEGDPISLTLKADLPYSSEAIPMKDRVLMDKGELKTIYGNARFSYYLGTEPTGNYSDISVEAGSLSMDEMKKEPYLHVVNFSDFQMDSLTGHFGGEIRLAFLYDGEKEIPVTGGSINGSIFDVQGNMRLSCEMQEENGYSGPFAVYMKGVNVAGSEA